MTSVVGRLTQALTGLRGRLGDAAATRWLIGGADERTAPSLWQGIIGSLLIMVGSWGVGWLAMTPQSVFARSTLLNPLRVEPVGVVACAIGLVLGSLLLVRAWLRLGQRLEAHEESGLPVVIRAAWLWTAPLMLAFPVFSRDVYSYIGQGRMLHAGLNPYEDWISVLPGWFMQGSDTIWAESPSPYGPLFLLLARGVWFLTQGSPEPAILLFRLVSVAGLALCLWAVPRLARRFGAPAGWATWVSVTNPLFALYMVAGIHNDSLMAGLLLVGFVLIGPRSSAAGNLTGLVLVCLSIAIKPLTVIALPFAGLLLLRGAHQRGLGTAGPATSGPASASPEEPASPGLRARIRVWALCLAVAAVVMTGVGWASGLWFGWVPAMLTSGNAAFPYAPYGLLGLGIGWLVSTLSGAEARAVADVVYAGGKVLVVGLTAWLALTRRPINPVLATGIALLAAVLLAPIIQPWYLLWVLPMLAVVRRWRGWPVWTLHLLVMALVVVGVVDQISVGQWISLFWVRVTAAAVGLAYMVFIVFLDPKTAALFPFTGRWRSRRRQRLGRPPAPEPPEPSVPSREESP